jgi:hypothetical protein
MVQNMLNGKHVAYTAFTLKPFVEKLIREYYNALEVLCKNGVAQAERVKSLEMDTAASEYAQLCCEVIREIDQHIRDRKEKFIPYILELTEKVETNHDCSACREGCKAGHNMQVFQLNASNDTAKKILNRIQLSTLPLYSHTMFPDEYRILRNRMALIEMNTTELFFLENTYLIPKIIAAQKAINAGNK